VKAKVNKDLLLAGVQVAQSAVSARAMLPYLLNILVEAKQGRILFVGTNLDMTMKSIVEANIEEEGVIAVPARRFYDVIRELEEGEVILSATKNDRLSIECKRASFKIMGMSSEDFAKINEFPEGNWFEIGQKTLKEMINMTSFSMSHEDSQSALRGTNFAMAEGKLTVVATDGRRMAMLTREIDSGTQSNVAAIVPDRVVYELGRILKEDGTVRVVFTDRNVAFKAGNVEIISKLMEYEFPDFRKAIPEEKQDKITVKRQDLLGALKRVALLTTNDSTGVNLDVIRDRMILSKTTEDIGEAREQVDVQNAGADVSIVFNPDYLIDVLKAIPEDEVNLEFLNSSRITIRYHDRYVYVIVAIQMMEQS
jgi:DNA polymerase-3 subunit beta